MMPAMKAGSYHEGELWLRCPFCGDSESHQSKAHFSVSNSGLYHCFRCNKSGRLPMKRLIELYSEYSVMDLALQEDYELSPKKFKEVFELLLPGPANGRSSSLDRYKLGNKDIFLSRRPSGELVGLAVVDGKDRRVIGNRSFGFSGEMISSSPTDPIRLVEGPYDCLDNRDVCVFGSISVKHLQRLRSQCVILCPDGDIWNNEGKRISFLRCIRNVYGKMMASVVAVEILPYDLDPAQVPFSQRLSLSPKGVLLKYG